MLFFLGHRIAPEVLIARIACGVHNLMSKMLSNLFCCTFVRALIIVGCVQGTGTFFLSIGEYHSAALSDHGTYVRCIGAHLYACARGCMCKCCALPPNCCVAGRDVWTWGLGDKGQLGTQIHTYTCTCSILTLYLFSPVLSLLLSPSLLLSFPSSSPLSCNRPW